MSRAARRKRLGQHFLHDPHAVAQIVAAIAPDRQTPIVEIGPGRGAITIPLLEQAGRLHVIEIDTALAEALAARCAGIGDLRIHVGDALKFDFCALATEPLKVAGNLPYSISTPLLFHLLAHARCVQEMTFMLQQEVVDRMCAEPGSHAYGRLSVMIQARCEVRELFSVGRGAFSPPPQVDSAVVRMLPRGAFVKTLKDEALFDQLVRLAFGQRRKKLRNALKDLVPTIDALLAELGIAANTRAEEVTVEQFGLIANRVKISELNI